mmetsp:Transcript_77017/g.194529  ORF Transcript_77017/g.194529 Transcript_77017/m.194529 type:complete len:88 (+) Transcript_77017:1304-1567(+)
MIANSSLSERASVKQKSDTYCLGVVVDELVVVVCVEVEVLVVVSVKVVVLVTVLVVDVEVDVVVGTKPKIRLECFGIHSSKASGKVS